MGSLTEQQRSKYNMIATICNSQGYHKFERQLPTIDRRKGTAFENQKLRQLLKKNKKFSASGVEVKSETFVDGVHVDFYAPDK